MHGFYKIVIKKASLNFPIIRWFSITIFLSLILTFPRQTLSAPYGLVTDQGTIPGMVVIINLDKEMVVETIDVGINPEGIEAYGTADGGYAYVANRGSDSVSVIELNVPNSRVIETITGSFDMPFSLDITSDNRYVHVINASMSNNSGITVIDTNDYSVYTAEFGFYHPAPGGIDIDGYYAFVGYSDYSVWAFNTYFDTIYNTYNYTEDWSVNTSFPNGKLDVTPSYIYVITFDTVTEIERISPHGTVSYEYTNFNQPANIEMHPNGNNLYVTNKVVNGFVTVIDTTQEGYSFIDVGNSPIGIDFYGTTAYVVNSGNGTISIIDASTPPGNVIGTISDPILINSPVEIDIIEGPENLPPYEPFNPNPLNGQTGVPISTDLSWEGGDPDGDPVTYDVFMGTNTTTGLEQVCSGIVHPTTSCTPTISPLEYGTIYYWEVKATDSYGYTSDVPPPYWSFTTEESPAPCEVTITPESDTVSFGETVQFSASTTCNGEDVSGSYFWDLTSSIGSNIDENGLYTAGNAEGTDMVTVTDTANGDITNTAQVTVVSEPPCEVSISPSSETVSSNETIAFSATTNPTSTGIACEDGSYQWEVDSPVGSFITQAGGLYTAGLNDTGEDIVDTVTVTDTANGNITDRAEVTVLAEPQEEYMVVITPDEITLPSKKPFRFTAQTLDAETNNPIPVEECRYRWEISPRSTIGSTILSYGEYGLYRAGLNKTRDLITETVIVSDTAHNDVSAAASVTVLVRFISPPYLILPPGPLRTSYRMISVGPIWPIDGDALHIIHIISVGIIKEYHSQLIRLFRWDGQAGDDGQGDYREYPDIPKLEPGIGIWVITKPGGFIQVDGIPIDTSQAFTITLPPGWTQIGHPFPFPVDWNQVDASTEVEPPWTFPGYYQLSRFLRPWHGYFVYNRSNSPVTISIPPQESEEEISKTYMPLSEEEGWQLQIGVNNIPFFWLQDTYNFIGVSENSSTERDPKDLHEAPPISLNQASLYFPHEWEGKLERFATDFRSLDTQKEVFECTVNPGSRIISLIRLFWSDMAQVPEEYQMEFIDPEKGITINMREVNEYWFISYSGIDKHFQISMTKN